jgi:geranylgeranyl reductase family protein
MTILSIFPPFRKVARFIPLDHSPEMNLVVAQFDVFERNSINVFVPLDDEQILEYRNALPDAGAVGPDDESGEVGKLVPRRHYSYIRKGLKYDTMRAEIAVVGGGPAGSTTAWQLAQRGYSTVVIERRKPETCRKTCGGLVSARVVSLSKTDAVVHEISGATVFFPNGRHLQLGGDRTRAFVIDRYRFDRELADKAAAAGATYLYGRKITAMTAQKITTPHETIRFDRMIGADGARSTVAKTFGFGPVPYINAVQGETTDLDAHSPFVNVYFDPRVAPGFFAWGIPDGRVTRTGLGSTEKGLCEKLSLHAKKIGALIRSPRGGVIPVNMRVLYRNNIALVGDAAGQVKATSGGGLYAGLFAARTLAETFDDFTAYKNKFMRGFGRELKRTVLAHRFFARLESADFNTLYRYLEKEVNGIGERGDIDLQTVVGMALLKRHPSLLLLLAKLLVK